MYKFLLFYLTLICGSVYYVGALIERPESKTFQSAFCDSALGCSTNTLNKGYQ